MLHAQAGRAFEIFVVCAKWLHGSEAGHTPFLLKQHYDMQAASLDY
jgi:hypothetical protein